MRMTCAIAAAALAVACGPGATESHNSSQSGANALRDHVNKQVRLTGTLDVTASNSAGPQRVRVDTVEPIGDRCATP